MAEWFQPSPEAATGAAHSLGDRPHLAATLGEQMHDPVGLTQLVGAQHDPLIAIVRHQRSTSAHISATQLAPSDKMLMRGTVAGSPPPELHLPNLRATALLTSDTSMSVQTEAGTSGFAVWARSPSITVISARSRPPRFAR